MIALLEAILERTGVQYIAQPGFGKAGIVADPEAIAVTTPPDDTVATEELDVAHVTVAPLIVLSFASFTVATKDAASLMDVNDRLVGASVTEAAV